MKVIRLVEYASEGELTEVEDARFFARKLGSQDELDFSGVKAVSTEYLDVLLEGLSLESLEGRLLGLEGEVDEALAVWAESQSSLPPMEKTNKTFSKRKVAVVPQIKTAEPIEYERSAVEGERYTPTRLVARLRRQLRSYIESAYPLNDAVMVRARRRLLEDAEGGHLLAQEPYLETTSRYKSFDGGYDTLDIPSHFREFFSDLARMPQRHSDANDPRTLLYPEMYIHQAEAFEEYLGKAKDVIVATGTGSGKTECFLVPMLGKLYDEARLRPDSFALPGVRALILYPMNALVNDQLTRLRLLLGDPGLAEIFRQGEGGRHPTFGMYTGRTLYPGPRDAAKDRERVRPLLEYYTTIDDRLKMQLQSLGRYPAKDLERYYGKALEEKRVYQSGKRKGKEYTRYHWDQRLHTQPEDRELLTRQEMVHGAGTIPGHSPDVLVTNYSMLEYMLLRPFERPIFQETKEWLKQEGNEFLIVLDEAHMYRGAKGAEVGFLLRRLRARLGINEHPEKFRVICTSASLGKDKESKNKMRRFAADLTGKSPTNFVIVTGERDVPTPASSADVGLGDVLADIDLDKLHAAATPADLLGALTPFFLYLNKPCPVTTDEEVILKHLHTALEDRPFLNLLLKETAGEAKSLASLADTIFPEHTRGRKAVEVLVTLGTIARKQRDEPGLVPTRVHAWFRGLQALYACINPECGGRQDAPGEHGLLGKLFAEPRTTCDACGSRVFELASCRNCGSPYVKTYTDEGLGALSFLWGETEGNVQPLELLPMQPRYQEATEEILVHVRTGYVDREHTFPAEEVRSLWLFITLDGDREHQFQRCAMCQPPGSRARSRITDFRTKGEQGFTALIEAQFSEQPPQKSDKKLPNQGRKVLVFSDGRQKAARLAPALEHSHARDLFRQVVAVAVDELKKQTGFTSMHMLYPAVVWVCQQRGINLFPSPDETEFHDHLRRARGKTLNQLVEDSNQGYLHPIQSYAQQLFSELTDRYYSLNALALGSVEEDRSVRGIVLQGFPEIDLPGESKLVLLRVWIRMQLEARRFLPPGADISSLGEGWERPEGIDPMKPAHVCPDAFMRYLEVLLIDEKKVQGVREWLTRLVRSAGLLRLENDRYFLQPAGLSINLKLDEGWLACSDCGRLYKEVLADLCPACRGTVSQGDTDYIDARTGFYREQVRRAFDQATLEPFGLTAAEHSAQLTGLDDEQAYSKTEKYELRFQDILVDEGGPIDILSCTTTMEVGIDIGTLSGVALRNVPPHVANYQQRAGRAGRRGRSVASVLTYAHGTSHDAHYYNAPSRIISGDVLPPVVYIENQKVLRRHINAYLVQRFFHSMVTGDPTIFKLFESLGTVEQFLSDQYACSLAKLEQWLKENRDKLMDELHAWVPTFSFAREEEVVGVANTVENAIDELLRSLYETLPVIDYSEREQLDGLPREGLERQLGEGLLDTLITRAILPRYAFPMDVVSFWVSKLKWRGDPAYKRSFDYEPQRDLQIALSEYAPGSSLTIDKWRFRSEAIYSPYAPEVQPILQKAQAYVACKACGYVSLQEQAEALSQCPCCGGEDLFRQRFITPEGFAPDVNAKRETDRGQQPTYAGRTTKAQLEVQEKPANWDRELFDGRLATVARAQRLVAVNKGVDDRGFLICPECGRTEPVYGPGFPKSVLMKGGVPRRHYHPLEQGMFCDGQAVGPYFLGHRFPTDVLLMKLSFSDPVVCTTSDSINGMGRAGRVALTSLVEAICLAASRSLQIDEGELSGNWSPVLGGSDKEVQLFLYDLLPGGAGYTKLVKESLDHVLAEAEQLLSECDCETSCYRCLRHYGNNFYHASLDRQLALALLRYVRFGVVPVLTNVDKEHVLAGLVDVVNLKGYRGDQMVKRNGIEVPLIIYRNDGSEVWVEAHHPLINAELTGSTLRAVAESELQEYLSLDAFSLLHDLPGAYASLEL